jgi:hypothetical protein
MTAAALDMPLLRRLSGGDPARLPRIMASEGWTIPPRVGGRRAFADGVVCMCIYMSVADAQWLRSRVPLEVVEHYQGRATVFRLALEKHHLLGGYADAAPALDASGARALVDPAFGFREEEPAP